MTSDQKKHTVLVVDDTPQNIELLVEVLKGDYRVQVARNGERALSLAAGDDPPHLILLDVMMPGMDGPTCLEHLRADPRTSAVPVIFLTAKGDELELKSTEEDED